MIVDFESEALAAVIHTDLCVIGSGAAGIAIAREFIGTTVNVLILEGGGKEFEPDSQEPYRSVVTALPHQGVHHGRARVLGGTTTLWAGQALPLFEIDFAHRDWVPNSGWPITRSELLPYYRRAELVMQIPHRSYDHQTWPRETLPPLAPGGEVEASYSQFAAEPDFARKYRKDLSPEDNVTVLMHANAICLEPAEDLASLRSVHIRSFAGKTARVSAQMFVVCCGGIDTARLLLASNSVDPAGVGNEFDNVGRYFQDHPSLLVRIFPQDRLKFDKGFGPVRTKAGLNLIKLHPSVAFQRKHEILNVGAEVNYSALESDSLTQLRTLKARLRRAEFRTSDLREIARAARHPCDLLYAAYWRCVAGNWQSPERLQAHLFVSSEQEPHPASRILLSEDRDSLGMKRASVEWRLTSLVTKSVERFLTELAKHWREMGIASLDVDDAGLPGRESGMDGGFGDINHHIGTTRMGHDPKSSVVDQTCRVHGYRNLYIGGSSVFPTGGFSNPTLTILALCLRISDQIKSQLCS